LNLHSKLPLIIQKYGGATLSTPEKIKVAAQNISELFHSGHRVIVVVSAMGKTTNELISLANQVSTNPVRRELDMLLTVGERISMALMSLALNDIGVPAISLTGSQAGVLTDDAHQNAFIKNIQPKRIVDALDKKQVVVLAGFQGVSPTSKEITTLGRGGTDTTAVAIAAALNAERCEILKDVSAVFTADPHLVDQSQALSKLNYEQLLDMTFWGAKVLQYRAVELAKNKNIKLYIGPAQKINRAPNNEGTSIEPDKSQMTPSERTNMQNKNDFESSKILSINSHEKVLLIYTKLLTIADGLSQFKLFLLENEIAIPQILEIDGHSDFKMYLTGPSEVLTAIENLMNTSKNNTNMFSVDTPIYATVTATSTGSTSPEVSEAILTQLNKNSITPLRCWLSALSNTVLIFQHQRIKTIEALHRLIDIDLYKRGL
jgi:aspartate kinase